MTQELVRSTEEGQVLLEAARPMTGPDMNMGAVSIEQQRAITEAQGQLVLAKRFPRSVAASTVEFLDACKSRDFAEAAFYSVPNRGSGPSIRFAEEAARCYGNFEFGHRELSRSDGKSEVEVYAWDKEKNNFSRRQITILHVVDTKNGPRILRDQADIDNRIANIASKQARGRILALLPKAMVEAGKAEVKRTLAGNNEKPVSQRIIDMTTHFARIGVTADMLTEHLGHKLEDTTIDELADMHGIFNAIREGAKPSEFFGAKEETSDTANALATAGKEAVEKKPAKPKVEAAKEPAKEEPKADTQPAAAQEAQQAPEAAPATEEAAPAADAAPEPAQAQEASSAAPAARKEAVF